MKFGWQKTDGMQKGNYATIQQQKYAKCSRKKHRTLDAVNNAIRKGNCTTIQESKCAKFHQYTDIGCTMPEKLQYKR